MGGTNTLTIHVPYDVETPYTVIDHMIVTQMKKLARCTPGSTEVLDWTTQTDNPDNKVTVASDNMVMADGYVSAAVSGRVELSALGPWSLQFDVDASSAAGTADTLSIRINRENSELVHAADGVKKVSMPIHGAHVQYGMEWQSESGSQTKHMRVGQAVAVCQGCSDTTCTRDPVTNLIVVRHPHRARGGLGVGLGRASRQPPRVCVERLVELLPVHMQHVAAEQPSHVRRRRDHAYLDVQG